MQSDFALLGYAICSLVFENKSIPSSFITFTLSIYEQTVKSSQKPLTAQIIEVIIYAENNDRQNKRRKKR